MKKTTYKEQVRWIAGIVDALPQDLTDNTGDAWHTVAANITASSRGEKTPHAACENYLRGCGLHGFPVYDCEHVAQLVAWGYSEKVAQANAPRFFTVSASLLMSALLEKGYNFRQTADHFWKVAQE